MNIAIRSLLEVQETSLLVARAARRLFRRPSYFNEMVAQADVIGVGSLTIILLTGFFTGGVLTLQTYPTLKYYGAQDQTGYLVALSLVRELGPVLTALMVTGRVGSAISAELGSMVVSQQIDAMRALGTDPIRKLVTPRIIALVVTMPLLTVAADVFGIIGGGTVATTLYGQSADTFVSSVRYGIQHDDILGGVIKPLFFALLIGGIACHKGLSTEGGTVGVGRSTTSAVVTASIAVIVADFFLAKALQVVLDMPK
jgi:phospholipid/cholesterol/gamma-HCH transport system permease protein